MIVNTYKKNKQQPHLVIFSYVNNCKRPFDAGGQNQLTIISVKQITGIGKVYVLARKPLIMKNNRPKGLVDKLHVKKGSEPDPMRASLGPGKIKQRAPCHAIMKLEIYSSH